MLGKVSRSIVLVIIGLALVTEAKAGLYLVGAQLFQSGSMGQNTGGPWQYSTNSSTEHSPFSLNGGRGLDISYSLMDGDNTFFFQQRDNVFQFAGLNLFFSTTPSPKVSAPGSVVPGDLTVFSKTDGLPDFSVTGQGTTILSYGTNHVTTTAAAANGAASMLLDGREISVAAFDINLSASGSFTIRVAATAVPEPSTLASLAVGGVALVLARVRRIRRAWGA